MKISLYYTFVTALKHLNYNGNKTSSEYIVSVITGLLQSNTSSEPKQAIILAEDQHRSAFDAN